jgi:hypothetical protein
MKWIKLFEGYLDQPEYEEIKIDDYLLNILNREYNLVNINPNIVNQIKGKIPNNVKFKLTDHDSRKKWREPAILVKIIELTSDKFPYGWKVTIYELEDEWFVVCEHNPLFAGLIQKSFKCDGTSGLLKCLKDRYLEVH